MTHKTGELEWQQSAGADGFGVWWVNTPGVHLAVRRAPRGGVTEWVAIRLNDDESLGLPLMRGQVAWGPKAAMREAAAWRAKWVDLVPSTFDALRMGEASPPPPREETLEP